MRTIEHYDCHAQSFKNGTLDHDVSQNIAALLDNITAPAPYKILDVGCGPGRDLKTFVSAGHTAIGLDGSARFVEMARAYSGCEVWHQNLVTLELPMSQFNGVYANAVLFHLPGSELPAVLKNLYDTLTPGGVLFTSNPHGDNREGWNADRFGSYHDFTQWRDFVTAAGFTEIDHYYRPSGLPRAQQPWLASVWRK
ncbi:MAG: class I SAM-dependent methyltransferase [Proteobacteria bacterium]|nr:class I SAM-dependent methyltransferase [Pseudomonadota bacterium]